jgi:hypothetical protein
MTKYLWQHFETFGTKDILAAAGSVIAAWNLCEISLMSLLSILIPKPADIGRKTFAILGNASRLELLRVCAGAYGEDAEDRIEEFATQYAICLENRNLIAHSIFQKDFSIQDEKRFLLSKFTKGGVDKMNTFAANESEMLEIANQCWTTHHYGMQIFSWILTQPGNQLEGVPATIQPLPDRPQRPRKLNPLPPRDQDSAQRPPQSSPE